jgi:molybdopterin/thiamine biosynthesis adenylyltransferase
LPDIQTVDRASLDRFIADLVAAGFKPPGANGRTFEGPLHPALAEETRSRTMRIEVRDGWPFVHPAVRVEGLKPSVHLTGSYLCLWRLGDDSYGWLRLGTLNERIGQWAERYRGRATEEDPVLDPQLYWSPYNGQVLATVDLRDVPYGNGGSGDLWAERDELLLRIGASGPMRVRWYGRDEMRHPPASLEMIAAGLKTDQAANFGAELDRVGHADGASILMVVWDTPAGEPNALILGLSRESRRAPVRAEAYEVARVDHDVLIRRAGPDAPVLLERSVVIFGQGAVGSHLSELIASSGVGRLHLVDGERLRPGDVVRHAGPRAAIGVPKAATMDFVIRQRAPWATVDWSPATWSPAEIRPLLEGRSLIVDAVGEEPFTAQLSRFAQSAGIPLLSVALYRQGFVARARLFAPGGVAIHERTDTERFPPIPAGPLEPDTTWETGCAAPINNAPPTSVVSAAALAARLAVEFLTDRETGCADIVEVYRALEEPPFDRVGAQRFE